MAKTAKMSQHGSLSERHHSPVQQIRLNVSGLQIRCLIAGSSSPAVVLLHGAGLDAAGLSLGSAMIALADRCQVFAPDLPGFGDSDPMPVGWGFAEYSAFLGPLLDALRLPRASLAGLSMGGGIALGFALRAPERVEKLALIDSACLDDAIPGGQSAWFFVHTPGLSAIGWSALRSSRHAMRRALLHHMRHRPELVTPKLIDDLMRLARKRAGSAVLEWQRREVSWNGLRTNYVNRLAEIAIPTLIVHGKDDQLLPIAIAERAHHLIPNSRLEIIPDCGHLAPLEQPEAVNRALCEFLRPSP
jgi:pimeloyl-ACP methyl ester carboxylesterase